MSAEGKIEKTRIQDINEAHEEANMLSSYFESGEKPTAEDYDQALYQLEMLQKAVEEESVPESTNKALRTFFAGASVATERIPKLLLAAALNLVPGHKGDKDATRRALGGGVIEQLKGVGNDYTEARTLFQTAREELEKWKADAEKLAKRQTEQK